MKAIQLPLSNLNNVVLEDMPEFKVISGNSLERAKGAAILAIATGSKGASEFMNSNKLDEFGNEVIDTFAIVERIK